MTKETPKFRSFKAIKPQESTSEKDNVSISTCIVQSKERRKESKDRVLHPKGDHKSRDFLQEAIDPYVLPRELRAICTIDKKGDTNNLTFEHSYKHSVPAFERYSSRVLGTKDLMLSRNSAGVNSHDKNGSSDAVALGRSKRPRLYVPNSYVRRLKRNKEKILTVSESDYVAIDHVNPFDVETVRNLDHRSINRVPESTLAIEDDEESLSEGGATEILYTTEIKQKVASLSQQVAVDPQNIEAWIEYANIQDEFLLCDRSEKGTATRRATCEIKMSILEQAMRHIFHEKLVIPYLHFSEEALDYDTVLLRWKWALKYAPNSHSLIHGYLDFMLRNNFEYSRARTEFEDFFKYLNDMDNKDETTELFMTKLLAKYTTFVLQCGYDELAIGIYQALIEYNFFSPKPGMRDLELLADFEAFWDSEVPRFGEVNAPHWHKYKEFSMDTIVDGLDNGLDKIDQNIITSKARFPLRTTNELADEDPNCVVLFEDIQSVLIHLKHPKARDNLLQDFLALLGLSQDRVVIKPDWNSETTHEAALATTPLVNGPGDLFQLFPYIPGLPTRIDMLSMSCNYEHILRILKQCRQSRIGNQDLALYHIALTFRRDRALARKICRSWLSIHSSSEMWSSYFLVIWLSGDLDEARSTMRSVLKTWKRSKLFLWSTWIECEYFAGNTKHATELIQTICQSSTHKVDGFTTILGSSHEDDSDENILYASRIEIIKRLLCDSLESALSFMYAEIGMTDSTHKEKLLQFSCILLYHYRQENRIQPRVMRRFLEHCNHAFPTNSIFFNMYVEIERPFAIEDRVRKLYNNILLDTARFNLATASCALAYEFECHRRGSNNDNVVATLLDQLHHYPVTRHSPEIRLAEAHFRTRSLKYRFPSANSVLELVHACPWHKGLATLLICETPPEMEVVVTLHKLMMERGLRVDNDLPVQEENTIDKAEALLSGTHGQKRCKVHNLAHCKSCGA